MTLNLIANVVLKPTGLIYLIIPVGSVSYAFRFLVNSFGYYSTRFKLAVLPIL